jgi:hypothetical protein
MSPTFSHGKSFFRGRHFRPTGTRHGVPVRQETVKKGQFTDMERTLLRDILYGKAGGQDYMHLIGKPVSNMKKRDMQRALEALRRMPKPENAKAMEIFAGLLGKLQERLEKIKADEKSQQQRRNQ